MATNQTSSVSDTLATSRTGHGDYDPEAFRQWYHKNMLPWLETTVSSQAAARQAKNSRMPLFYAGLALGTIAIVYLFISGSQWAGITAGVTFFLLFVLYLFTRSSVRSWNKDFRNAYLSRIFAYFGLRYANKPGADQITRFRKLGLVPHYDKSVIDDYVSGEIDGAAAELFGARLLLLRGPETPIYSVKPEHRNAAFVGLLAVFAMPRPFGGYTVIHPTSLPNRPTPDSLTAKVEKVNLEDPTFNATFDVYSSDQLQARVLLTPTFMERILVLKQALHNTNLSFAFYEGEVAMSIQQSDNFFQSLTAQSDLLDESLATRIVEPIAKILDVVRILRLGQEQAPGSRRPNPLQSTQSPS